MYNMCTNHFDCIKQQMSHYLGEFRHHSCGTCTSCQSKRNKLTDFTQLGDYILKYCAKLPGSEVIRDELLQYVSSKHRDYNYYDVERVLNELIMHKRLKVAVRYNNVHGVRVILQLIKTDKSAPVI